MQRSAGIRKARHSLSFSHAEETHRPEEGKAGREPVSVQRPATGHPEDGSATGADEADGTEKSGKSLSLALRTVFNRFGICE